MLLEEVKRAGVARVGEKAATLGDWAKAGFPVPAGVCPTTAAFHLALRDFPEAINQVLGSSALQDLAMVQAAADRPLIY